jgi:hypothetical protein
MEITDPPVLIGIAVVLFVIWKVVSFVMDAGSSPSTSHERVETTEDRAKKIREAQRRREQNFELGEYDMPCPICKRKCRPMRGTRTQYDCAKCDKQFEGPRHDF